MSYFVRTLRVHLLLFSVIVFSSNSTSPLHLRRNADLIATLLQKFIKFFIKSIDGGLNPPFNTTIKYEQQTKIAKLIRKKVMELKPLLEDDDTHKRYGTEENLTLKEDDGITVIEFLTQARKVFKTDPLKEYFNRYKLLREQVKVAVDDEPISKETKNLIINTLDKIVTQLIESQCTWNPNFHSVDIRLLKLHNNTRDSIAKLRQMTKKQWRRLILQYLDFLNKKRNKENTFMTDLHNFLSSFINDIYKLSDRYKIKCQLIERKNGGNVHKIPLKALSISDTKDLCDKFRVCSDELKKFLKDFYTYVNDTAVGTFKNYAEMFARDVNVGFGPDKTTVAAVLNTLASNAEKKVIKIYKKAVKKFTLDPNKSKHANIKLLNSFIKNVVQYVTNAINENIVKELAAMKTQPFITVKEDLIFNLEVDMENLEKNYTEVLCLTFLSCNGQNITKKQPEPWIFRPKANRKVFVKVQPSFDDDMKSAVVQRSLLRTFDDPANNRLNITNNIFANVNITRTTIQTTSIRSNYEKNKKHRRLTIGRLL